MSRPYVQIQSENKVDQLKQHLASVLPRLKALPGVVGITLNGGLSRGYADHLSEIDVTLYLNPATYQHWQAGNAPIPCGICMLAGMLYDVKIVDFKAEQARGWENDALWDASYANILYDPAGLLTQLWRDKLANYPQPQEAERDMFSCWWYFQLAGDIWIHRDDGLQAHHIFNQAVVSLVKALFTANREFVPHEKWLIHMSRSLHWTPDRWPDRLREAMHTGDTSEIGLRQRQAVIEALWLDIDTYIHTQYPDLPVYIMQKSLYELLRMLVNRKSVSIAEWQVRAGLERLNQAPFYGIATVDGDMITLDQERLLSTRPEEMYTWHYEVLRRVLLTTSN